MKDVPIEVPRLQHNKTLIVLGLTDSNDDSKPIDLTKLDPVTVGTDVPKTVDNLIKEVKPKKKITLKKIADSFDENDEIKTVEKEETFVFESMKDFDYSSLSNPDSNSQNDFFKDQVATVKCLKEIATGMSDDKFIEDFKSGNLEKFLNNFI